MAVSTHRSFVMQQVFELTGFNELDQDINLADSDEVATAGDISCLLAAFLDFFVVLKLPNLH